MIIDAHTHLVAPASLYVHRSSLIVSGGNTERAIVSVVRTFGATRGVD